MQGATSAHQVRAAFAAVLFVAGSIVASALPARAIDLWDGKVEIHGYYEQQVRSLWTDFSGSNDWDLSQWYHVLNLEIEADIAPDGFGPFDLVSAFARIEGRFDCVLRRGCYLLPNVDVYGDRPGRLPQRISSGRENGWVGTHYIGDTRREHDDAILTQAFRNRFGKVGSRRAVRNWGGVTYNGFYGASLGLDGILSDFPEQGSDDPALLQFQNLNGRECLWGSRKTKGPTDGFGVQALPITPGCKIQPIHDNKQVPNPFRPGDPNKDVLGGAGGGLALPFRPAPEVRFDAGAPKHVPQGIWYPNERLQDFLAHGDGDAFDQNFTVNELQWNRGASQQDEKELKEAYLEIEMLDSRLWVRAGKQNIVWGKTELFRTTDQFNPQDLALASLPNLEESRIALWAIRAIFSLYEVGPFEDVRLEVAANFDQFEPNDLGRCGEAYTPLVACSKTFGLLNHGQNGIGLAGEIRPPNPWNSWKGIEIGGRIEWRWDRFSFAISDFYGYNDLPYADVLFTYSRNVDPVSGRPRKGESTGKCRIGTESDCLTADNALLHHSINQTAFAWVCAGTVGISALDPSACAQSVFGSQTVPAGAPVPISAIFGNILSGQNAASAAAPTGGFLNGNAFFAGLGGLTVETYNQLALQPFVEFTSIPGGTVPGLTCAPCPTPLVSINVDPADGGSALVTDFSAQTQADIAAAGGFGPAFLTSGISPFLTDQQEALLGCGPFYDTNCDVHGFDLLNADPNALFESFPTVEGTFRGGAVWDATDASRAQPGTIHFDGFTCAYIAGCRGPGDKGYRPDVDGTNTGLIHPFTGQQFRAEISAVSWNFMLSLVVNSSGEDGVTTFTARDAGDQSVFNPDQPFAKNRCSFREPGWCSAVLGLANSLTGLTTASVKAGGNGRFGRRQFLWQGGNDLVLRYERRNVLGFSMDFAEDTFKSNWSLEFTWIEGLPTTDANSRSGVSETDNFNLTVSVDRPTFINFLNANRTFFINSQWFFQYVEGQTKSHVQTGPWNVFFTFAVSTGYFQDRLLPSMVFVYDVHSNSGAWLPQITYRFTENFSATFGLGLFNGRWKSTDAPINDPAAGAVNRVGRHRDKQFFEPGLSVVRERDEVFLRLRYTF